MGVEGVTGCGGRSVGSWSPHPAKMVTIRTVEASRRPTHLRRVFDQTRLDASEILSDATLFMLVRYRGGGPYIVLDMAGCSSRDSPVYLQLTIGRAALPIEVCQADNWLSACSGKSGASVTRCNDMRKMAACWTCGRTFWVWRLRERNFCSGRCHVRHHRSAPKKPRHSAPGRTPAGTV